MFIEGVYLSHFFVVGRGVGVSWSELEFLPCREFLPSPIGIFMHHLDPPCKTSSLLTKLNAPKRAEGASPSGLFIHAVRALRKVVQRSSFNVYNAKIQHAESEVSFIGIYCHLAFQK